MTNCMIINCIIIYSNLVVPDKLYQAPDITKTSLRDRNRNGLITRRQARFVIRKTDYKTLTGGGGGGGGGRLV